MLLYPKNQTYIIIPGVLGETRFPDYYALARKNNSEKLWLWHWDRTDPALKEFAEDPDCETLTHDEVLEKMETHNWKTEKWPLLPT